MGETSEEKDDVSHGMCPECAREMWVGEVEDLQIFLDRFQMPILLVDADGVAVTGNYAAQSVLEKPLDQIRNFKGGEVMRCANASLPGGCGLTLHCSGCGIRNAILATHADGKRRREEVYHNIITPGGELSYMRLVVETECVSGVVILSIHEMAPAKDGENYDRHAVNT